MTDAAVLQTAEVRAGSPGRRPRLGFLGVGWIGRHRMEAAIGTGLVDTIGVADPSADARDSALALAPGGRAAAPSGQVSLLPRAPARGCRGDRRAL